MRIPRRFNSDKNCLGGMAVSGAWTPVARMSPRAIICAATEIGKPVSRATALKFGFVVYRVVASSDSVCGLDSFFPRTTTRIVSTSLEDYPEGRRDFRICSRNTRGVISLP